MDQILQKPKPISNQSQEHQQNQKNESPFCLESLSCSEEEEESTTEACSTESRPSILLDQDLSWDAEELSTLFAKEERNRFFSVVETDPSAAEARREAVEWILFAAVHHSFSPPTAVLAVNCLDRFFSSICFREAQPWMAQLAAVACLSVAAKVEETQVPLLLDLQVEESRFVFEAKTIQRMELLVLSTLQWKMNPVTPLSFLDYITRRLGLKGRLCREFLRRSELIVLSVITDARFMHYLPSVVAIATTLHIVNCVELRLKAEYHSQLLGILGIDHKDNVDECCKLMSELVANQRGKRKLSSIPGSPSGVMDVSFSSDSSSDSWARAGELSVSSSPEPMSKKSKITAENTL